MDQALPNGIPAHIPAHLVFDFDRFRAPETRRCPHREVHDLYRTAPRIFYTPRNGGHWIIGRAEDALDMLRRIDLFSSDPKYCPAMMREPRTNPNRYDPPEHTEFRAIINPFFSPRAVQARETEIRDLARALIAEVRVRGQCEFFEEIGRRYPVNIFLKMANAPPSDRAVLLEYVDGFTKKPDLAERNASLAALGEHLKRYVAEREAKPGDDIVSAVVNAQVSGRPIAAAEKIGMVTLLFLGGLDTVAAMLSFIMDYLGHHPEQYARIVNEPGLLPQAVEELMRVHGVAGMERAATHDFEYNGIQFKAGDHLIFQPQLYGLDEEKIDDPFRVDFDRPMSPHLVFGAGVHRCIGSHLARLEIRVFLEEWTRAIPKFRSASPEDTPTNSGIVWSPVAVNLVW